MKILWLVNTIFPYPSEQLNLPKQVFGGWLNSLFNELLKYNNIELAIVTVSNKLPYISMSDGKVKYYILPTKNIQKYDGNLMNYYNKVLSDFNPDIIHIHGTEYPYSLPLLKQNKNKTVVSIQGLASICAKHYLIGLKYKDIIKNITFRDIIRNDNIFKQMNKMSKRGKYEKEIIKLSGNIIGRTSWDYANTYAISNKRKYYFCNENLLESFYNNKWDINNIERKSLFISQAAYPIKGLHIFIEALALLKKDYPDIKAYIAGNNILSRKTLREKIKFSGYAKIISKMIKKYNLEDNIIFIGLLNEEKMAERLLKTNVYVQASLIENSPNSLGEAMLLGLPCVASNVGGTSDMLIDKKEGFLYPFTEPSMLASYISKIIEDDDLAIELGSKAREHSLITHNKEVNTKQMIEIYKRIIGEDK